MLGALSFKLHLWPPLPAWPFSSSSSSSSSSSLFPHSPVAFVALIPTSSGWQGVHVHGENDAPPRELYLGSLAKWLSRTILLDWEGTESSTVKGLGLADEVIVKLDNTIKPNRAS